MTSSGLQAVRPGLSRRRGGPARRPHAQTLCVLALCLVIAFLFVYPVVMLAVGAFRTSAPGLPGSWSTRGFVDAYTTSATYATLKNSIILSVAVQVFGTAIALFFAWVVARTNTPWRRLVTPMMVLVFAIPPLFFALSWAMLGSQPVGLIDKALEAVFGAGTTPFNVESWYGLIGVETLKVSSIAYLLLLGPFMAMDRSLEEASFASGAGIFRTLTRVTLPVLAPAITGLLILGFVVGLGILDVPLLLGLPAGIRVFPTEIYGYITNSTPSKYAQANSLSLLLVAIVIVLVWLQSRYLGKREFTTVTGKGHRTDPWDLGRWKYACTGAIAVYGLLAFVLPLAQLIVGSLQPIFGLYGHFTLRNFSDALNDPATMSALKNTVVVGLIGGFCAALIAVVVAYVRRSSRSALRSVPHYSVWLLWAVPGVTLGLAMSWAYLSVPGLRSLYATIWIVMIALVVSVTPVASRAADGSIAQIGRELEESSRVSGASAVRALVGIVARLILPSFLAAWFVTGVMVAGNLDVPILMSSPSNQTIPVLVYEQFSTGNTSQAAAVFCLILMVIAASMVAIGVLRLGLAIWRRVRPRGAAGGSLPAARRVPEVVGR